MAYQSFIYEVEDEIATVRLNDPDRLNALTFQTYEELERLTRELAGDRTIKVLVLTGEGKGFCSGGSVHEIIAKLLEMKGEALYRFTRMSCDVVKNMRNLKKPIVAAVNGMAAGAGAMLALASDFRIASVQARLLFYLSGWDSPAPTWARFMCCPGSSDKRGPPSFCFWATLSTRRKRGASAWPTGSCAMRT